MSQPLFLSSTDKIVVVGQANKGTKDWVYTPLGLMPGVFVHLNSIMSDQMLNGVKEATIWQELKTGAHHRYHGRSSISHLLDSPCEIDR